MAQVNKSALVPFSAEQMYKLVDDVPSYQDFLPWCGGSEEVSREEDVVVASVTIAKGSVNKTFTTKNTSFDKQKIHMELVEGPFKELVGYWSFKELKENACKVTLELDYEFSNRLLGMVVGPVFNQIANAMVDSFVDRAKEVYS
ncbi:MAG: type II toxin-antitoxin system RatA family toxin [Cocleimonas sp.]